MSSEDQPWSTDEGCLVTVVSFVIFFVIFFVVAMLVVFVMSLSK